MLIREFNLTWEQCGYSDMSANIWLCRGMLTDWFVIPQTNIQARVYDEPGPYRVPVHTPFICHRNKCDYYYVYICDYVVDIMAGTWRVFNELLNGEEKLELEAVYIELCPLELLSNGYSVIGYPYSLTEFAKKRKAELDVE